MVTRPIQGDPTRLAMLNALLDDLEDVIAAVGGDAGGSGGVPGGGMEIDTDLDGVPDGWAFTPFTGGTIAQSADAAAGLASVKITSPGGSGNGGGTLTNSTFLECAPARAYLLSWQTKSSVANMRNLVQIRWYSEPTEPDYLSTTTVFDDDTANPTAWQLYKALIKPPTGAHYYKIVFVGADMTDDTAGDVYIDDVAVEVFQARNRVEFRVAGAIRFTVPAGVSVLRAIAIGGAGGGGGGSGGARGSGGGGGGYSEKMIVVTPGDVVEGTVGAGGAGGASAANGSAGSATTIGAGPDVQANGGTGGNFNDSVAPGGAGAVIAGAVGDVTLPGGDGFIWTASLSGQGGHAVNGGGGAPGITGDVNGVAGTLPGEGGSGASGTIKVGGAGAAGAIIFEW